MFQIDVLSRTPVYEQIVTQMEQYVLSGILKSGEKLPSVRKLSVELAVNPNTIQRAMTELDRLGIITSVPGKGCFVSTDAQDRIRERKRNDIGQFRKKVEELALAGVDSSELIKVIKEVYGG